MGGERDRTEVARLKERVAELERLLEAQKPAASQAEGQAAILRTMVMSTATTGEEFFRSLVTGLASVLGVRCTFVGEIMGNRPGHVRTLALWMGGRMGENFEYALAGTPCEQIVTGRRMRMFARGIQQQFPDDRFLAESGMESYMGFPLLDEKGEVMGLVGVMHDAPMAEDSQAQSLLEAFASRVATELRRLRLAETLQESEEKYRLLFSRAMGAVVLFDVNTHQLLDVNDVAINMYGYSREEFLRLKIVDMSAEPAVSAAAIQRAAEAGGAYVPIRWNKKKDGTVFPVEISCGTFTWKGRTVMCGVLRDITERKRAEEALRHSEAQFRAISDASPLGIFLTDEAGDCLYSNQVYQQIAGLANEETLGKGWSRAIHPDDRERVFSAWYQAAQGRLPFNSEHRFLRPDGTTVWTIVMAAAIRIGEGVSGYVGTVHDVTDRKRLEDQLRQAAKMEAVGRLAGGIAHDFNNLLTVINGYSDLLVRSHEIEEQTRQQAEKIYLAGKRAADLTSQLLAFSRRQVIQPKVLDLNALVAGLVDMLRRLIGEDIRLETVLSAEPCSVKADPGQIEQVLVNMAINARDAMPEGGTLTVETALVRAEMVAGLDRADLGPGPFVRVTIRDSGAGMDLDTKAHIFEPFFTTKEQGKGTGLGLAMVYGIVTQNGGGVTVDSAPGEGATFTIYLPQVPGLAETGGAADPPDQSAARGETILLVEDDQAVRTFARQRLAEWGYEVLEAAGGEEALRRAESHQGPIHLLLTDVIMPGINGRQLAEQIRLRRPETNVLFMSGYTDDVVIRHGLEGLGGGFIQKPFEPMVLQRKIRAVLDVPRG